MTQEVLTLAASGSGHPLGPRRTLICLLSFLLMPNGAALWCGCQSGSRGAAFEWQVIVGPGLPTTLQEGCAWEGLDLSPRNRVPCSAVVPPGSSPPGHIGLVSEALQGPAVGGGAASTQHPPNYSRPL